MTEAPAMPLAFMSTGQTGTILEIRGQRHHHLDDSHVEEHAGPDKRYVRGHKHHRDRGHRLEHRLVHMGLVPGAGIRVMRNAASGPVIVAVGDTRLGLARGVASRVLVRPDRQEE